MVIKTKCELGDYFRTNGRILLSLPDIVASKQQITNGSFLNLLYQECNKINSDGV